ncbi:MAG: 4-alpha-glucanotransferase [Verrucomicrobiales bacterium]
MNDSNRKDLEKLASLEGIQTSYTDMAGQRKEASADTLVLLLERMGHTFEGQRKFRDACSRALAAQWKQPLPEVQSIPEGKLGVIRIRQPSSWIKNKTLLAKCVLENGDTTQIVLRKLAASRSVISDDTEIAENLYLLPRLPRGYHQLQIGMGEEQHTCLLISAPAKLYHPDTEQKKWGIFAPLYGIHSRDSWGAGNFSDWERLLNLTMKSGGGIVSGLPILGAFLDKPVIEPSPYSPASRLFWNEFYLDINVIPEFQKSDSARKLASTKRFSAKLEAFREADLVNYKEQMALRREVLEILAQEFFTASGDRRKEIENYLKSRPEAKDYAAFRATCDQRGKSWHTWDGNQKNGKLTEGKDYKREDFQYHLFAQWQAQQQIDRLIKQGREGGVELYLDLPVGVHPDSYDAWRERDSFASGVNAGSPPDPFFTKGQDWGFSPLHPKNMRKNRYDYLIRFFRFQMRHTGMLRVDHVMGLHRLFWIPQGLPASHGAYVTYPAKELYAILAVESHRFNTTMVGENLGTVPPEVNRSMDKYGMRRLYVAQYEAQPRQPPLAPPPKTVVASLNTHDMPPFAAFEAAQDTDDRKKLGLLKAPEVAEEKATRAKMIKSLGLFLRKRKLLKQGAKDGAELAKAVLRFLAESPAESILVNLEDLWGEKKSQNVPGTSSERPNWQRKLKLSLEDLESNEELSAFFNELNELRKKGKS